MIEQVYFDIVDKHRNTTREEFVRELVTLGNVDRVNREYLSNQIAKFLNNNLKQLLISLVDDSVNITSIRDTNTITHLLSIGIVTLIAMGNEDHVALSPTGKSVIKYLPDPMPVVMDRNQKLLNMLKSVNLRQFTEYTEELNGEPVVNIEVNDLTQEVVVMRMKDSGIRKTTLSIDSDKQLDIRTINFFKIVDSYLKSNKNLNL